MTPVTDSVAALCRDWPGPTRGKLLATLLDMAVAELALPADQQAETLTPAQIPAASMLGQALAQVEHRTIDVLSIATPMAFNEELPGQNGEADEARAMAEAPA